MLKKRKEKKKKGTHRWLFSSCINTQPSIKKIIIIKIPEVLNAKENISFTLGCKVGGNIAETTPVFPPDTLRF